MTSIPERWTEEKKWVYGRSRTKEITNFLLSSLQKEQQSHLPCQTRGHQTVFHRLWKEFCALSHLLAYSALQTCKRTSEDLCSWWMKWYKAREHKRECSFLSSFSCLFSLPNPRGWSQIDEDYFAQHLTWLSHKLLVIRKALPHSIISIFSCLWLSAQSWHLFVPCLHSSSRTQLWNMLAALRQLWHSC